MNTIARKMRQRRDARDFERALRNASPTMQQELSPPRPRAATSRVLLT